MGTKHEQWVWLASRKNASMRHGLVNIFPIMDHVRDLRLTEGTPRAMATGFLTIVWAVAHYLTGWLNPTSSSTLQPRFGLCLLYFCALSCPGVFPRKHLMMQYLFISPRDFLNKDSLCWTRDITHGIIYFNSFLPGHSIARILFLFERSTSQMNGAYTLVGK